MSQANDPNESLWHLVQLFFSFIHLLIPKALTPATLVPNQEPVTALPITSNKTYRRHNSCHLATTSINSNLLFPSSIASTNCGNHSSPPRRHAPSSSTPSPTTWSKHSAIFSTYHSSPRISPLTTSPMEWNMSYPSHHTNDHGIP